MPADEGTEGLSVETVAAARRATPSNPFETLDLGHASEYLRQAGWIIVRRDDLKAVWQAPSGAVHGIVPTALRDDHPNRMSDLVDAVATEERRDVEDVLIDLTWAGFDKLSVRARIDDRTSAVAMQTALDTHEAVRSLVVAAARAANEPRARYSRGWPGSVARFVDQVRWIPAVAGSYVVRALLPIQDEIAASLPFTDLSEPAIRKVSTTLVDAVTATRFTMEQVIREAAPLSEFDDLVPEGVSANLLDALAQLAGPPEAPAAFEVGVTWTYAAPQAPRRPVRFNREQVLWLGVAADHLRGGPETLALTANGLVTRLRRDTSTGPGHVLIEGFIEGTDPPLRRLEAQLNEPDYKVAVLAHREGAPIRMTCRAAREQGRVTVKSVTTFDADLDTS